MPDTLPPAKKILYIDLDNTLVDFPSGIARLSRADRAAYEGRYDDAPGIFALMDPLPGALEAYRKLARHFDTYILSTAPWHNASAWHDKVLWVQKHLGLSSETVAYKRLILSHHKNLNRGDFLVDDREANGAGRFEGEWLQFGPGAAYPSWESVTSYLLSRASHSMLDVAISLARSAHAGQRDKLGVAYICHPLAVMRRLSASELGDDAKIVAVLHDVVEDTPVTLEYLRSLGFSEAIVEAVDAITKRPGESLEKSMARVRANPLALVVKRADISHNADPARQAGLPGDERERLTVKYEESAKLLGTTLTDIGRDVGGWKLKAPLTTPTRPEVIQLAAPPFDVPSQTAGWGKNEPMNEEAIENYLRIRDSDDYVVVPEPLWQAHPLLSRLYEIPLGRPETYFYFSGLTPEQKRDWARIRFWSQDPDNNRFDQMILRGEDLTIPLAAGESVHADLWWAGRIHTERWLAEVPRTLELALTEGVVTDFEAGTLSNADRDLYLRYVAPTHTPNALQRARLVWSDERILTAMEMNV